MASRAARPDVAADGARATIERPRLTYTTVARCRVCGAGSLAEVLSLGRLPLANALLSPHAELRTEPRYPLEIVRC